MSVDHASLLKIVKPQMKRLWRRVGWLWLGMLITAQLAVPVPFLSNPGMPLQHFTTTWGLKVARYVLILSYVYSPFGLAALMWLILAWTAVVRVLRAYEDVAAPRPKGLRPYVLRLMMLQGTLLLGICLAGIAIYCITAYYGNHLYSQEYSLPGLAVLSGGLDAWFFAVGLMIWLLPAVLTCGDARWAVAWLVLPLVIAVFCMAAGATIDISPDELTRLYHVPQQLAAPLSNYGPPAIGALAMLILASGLALRSRRMAIAAASCVALLVTLSFMCSAQFLPVSVNSTSVLGRALLALYGLESMHTPLWGFYGPSYVTGGVGILDTRIFDYSYAEPIGVWDGLLLLVTYCALNIAWLWLQYKLVNWLRSLRAPAT